jgi:hypothetical protein
MAIKCKTGDYYLSLSQAPLISNNFARFFYCVLQEQVFCFETLEFLTKLACEEIQAQTPLNY